MATRGRTSTITAVPSARAGSTAPLRRIVPSPRIIGPRRSVSSLTGTQSWSDETGRFTAAVRVQHGAVQLLLEGTVDGTSLRICRLALAGAVRVRAERVSVDLARARLDERSVDPLARLIREAARFGVVLALRGLPVRLRAPLARIAPASGYVLAPGARTGSVPQADPLAGFRDEGRGLLADHPD